MTTPPRPPRIRVERDPNTPPPRPEPTGVEVAIPNTQRRPARRPRMGELLRHAGRAKVAEPGRAQIERERSDLARRLLKGGQNKGASKGYGVTPPVGDSSVTPPAVAGPHDQPNTQGAR